MTDKTEDNNGNHRVIFSCVMGRQPRFARQALGWAATLLVFGKQKPESLLVHGVEKFDPAVRRIFDSWGVPTRTVKRFAAGYPHANKLRQLESEALHAADHVVLCDCDLVFCDSIGNWVDGESIRGRTASYAGLSMKKWERLFRAASMELPDSTVTGVLDGRPMPSTYCNGALYIIPQGILQQLRPVWPKWMRWLSRRPGLVTPLVTYTEQFALVLACAELGLAVDQLPVEVNFPVRGVPWLEPPRGLLYRAPARDRFRPLVMHHHSRSRAGLLVKTVTPCLNKEIARANRLLTSVNRTDGKNVRAMIARSQESASHE
jgi:hypothetical protein